MPITLKLQYEKQYIMVQHIGEVPDNEFLTFYKDLFMNTKETAYMNFLIDLKQAKSVDRSTQALVSLAEFFRKIFTNIQFRRKVAVIAPTDISFGLARMYEIFSDDLQWDFVVFRDSESAFAWINNPNSPDSSN